MGHNTERHPTLDIGDQVRCLKPIQFCNGEAHQLNDILLVEEENLAYYQLFTNNRNYELWKRAQ